MRRAVATALLSVVLVTGCGKKKKVRTPPAPQATPQAPPVAGSTENGIASWYGHPYHGRQAANGEIYDMEQMTAAHRTLPFGTWVRVRNLGNSKSVDVRITDRGPFVDSRVIDLSHAAARAIEMIGPGTAPVQVEILSVPAAPAGSQYAVQVAAFRDRANAENTRRAMEGRYGAARIVQRSGEPVFYRVLVGAEPSQAAASGLAARIRQEGTEKAVFIVRLDIDGL